MAVDYILPPPFQVCSEHHRSIVWSTPPDQLLLLHTPKKARRQKSAFPNDAEYINREQAAALVGVSPNTFDKMVAAGEMPAPIRYRSVRRKVWKRSEHLAKGNAPPTDWWTKKLGELK
jgi:predicted DNA-binding transcriptional regulator AlpA